MPLIDTRDLPVVERRPGWFGRFFDSKNMTFGHYNFDAGATIHAHSHPQEEVWHIVSGELEITIAGVTKIAGAGFVGIIPPNTVHEVRALTNGKAIVVDYPLRDMGGATGIST